MKAKRRHSGNLARLGGVPKGRRPAFTLVELLTVVVIIAMLIGILMPSFKSVMDQAVRMKCQARLNELADGCRAFKNENNNMYPGQDNPQVLAGNGGTYTGSQYLALCLFTARGDIDTNGGTYVTYFPSNAYAGVNPSTDPTKSDLINMDGAATNYTPTYYVSGTSAWNMSEYYSQPGQTLVTGKTPTTPGRPDTISDRWRGTQMPVLYYPSRIDQANTLAQYVFGDNSAYFNAANSYLTSATWNAYITDPKSPNGAAHNNGSFLLVAPGVDRVYGPNPNNPNGQCDDVYFGW